MIYSDTIQTIEIAMAVVTPVLMYLHIPFIKKLLKKSGMDEYNYLLVCYLTLLLAFLWLYGFGVAGYLISESINY